MSEVVKRLRESLAITAGPVRVDTMRLQHEAYEELWNALPALLDVVEAAQHWHRDTGQCHFCMPEADAGDSVTVHEAGCPLARLETSDTHRVEWHGTFRGTDENPRETGTCLTCGREVYDGDGTHEASDD